jgi:hypothetical protein
MFRRSNFIILMAEKTLSTDVIATSNVKVSIHHLSVFFSRPCISSNLKPNLSPRYPSHHEKHCIALQRLNTTFVESELEFYGVTPNEYHLVLLNLSLDFGLFPTRSPHSLAVLPNSHDAIATMHLFSYKRHSSF